MTRAHLVGVAAQPDAAHREPGIAVPFGDLGFLQEFQPAAAGADEHELRRDGLLAAGIEILHRDAPAAVIEAVEVGDLVLVVDRKARLRLQLADQQVGERAVVDVRAGDHPGRGDGLLLVAPLHHQRRPLGDLTVVFAVFHAVIAVVRRHRLVPVAQEGDVLVAPDEAHMRAGFDEGVRVRDGALGDEVRPELARQVELGVDLKGPGNVDAAVGTPRRVVELAVGCVARARVVPRLRTFQCAVVKRLEHHDVERRLQLLENGAQRGAHDACADQDDVRAVRCGGAHACSSCSLA